MRLAIDTNAYRRVSVGLDRAGGLLGTGTEIYLPFVVLGELRSGFAWGTLAAKNEAVLTAFLQSPRVRVLLADEQTTYHYARLFAFLRRQGTPVPTNDLWIAALVVQHELPLLTGDEHFSRIPQVQVLRT